MGEGEDDYGEESFEGDASPVKKQEEDEYDDDEFDREASRKDLERPAGQDDKSDDGEAPAAPIVDREDSNLQPALKTEPSYEEFEDESEAVSNASGGEAAAADDKAEEGSDAFSGGFED